MKPILCSVRNPALCLAASVIKPINDAEVSIAAPEGMLVPTYRGV